MNNLPPLTASPEELWDHYHKLLGKRASKAMAVKAKSGDMPGCAPLGYKNVGDGAALSVKSL